MLRGPKNSRNQGGQNLTLANAKEYVKRYLNLESSNEAEINIEAINLVSLFRNRASKEGIQAYLEEKAKTKEKEKENIKTINRELSALKNHNDEASAHPIPDSLSIESTETSFTLEEAALKIKNELKWTNQNDIHLAAQYLVIKKQRFKTLNDPFTTAFIKNTLPTLMPEMARIITAATSALSEPPEFESVRQNVVIFSSSAAAAASASSSSASAVYSPRAGAAYSSNEQKKIAEFKELTTVGEANNSRYNQFVFLLGEPKLPTRHSGVDDSCHPQMDISFIWRDLLERGHTTLKLIHNRAHAQKPCPKVIFMRGPLRRDEDNLTRETHTGHTLDAYARHIENESQLPIEFHVAGHGTPEFIGPMILERRITPEDFADYFCDIASEANLLDTLKNKKLVFVFHTCNSAYVEINSADEDQKEKLKSHSIIGKFYQKMVALGFQNIEVSGFRGFYSTYMNGSGARVTGSLDDDNSKTYSAENAKFTILKVHGVESVELPKGEGLNFPVRFKGVSPKP